MYEKILWKRDEGTTAQRQTGEEVVIPYIVAGSPCVAISRVLVYWMQLGAGRIEKDAGQCVAAVG